MFFIKCFDVFIVNVYSVFNVFNYIFKLFHNAAVTFELLSIFLPILISQAIHEMYDIHSRSTLRAERSLYESEPLKQNHKKMRVYISFILVNTY